MIDARHPLGHAIVVGVFGLERELEQTAGDCSRQPPMVSSQTAIGPDLPKRGAAVCNQTDTVVVIGENIALHNGGFWGAKCRPDKVIVKIGRTQGNLCLLQSQKTIVVPRGLLKRDEGDCVPPS